jgi:hypothetical protein
VIIFPDCGPLHLFCSPDIFNIGQFHFSGGSNQAGDGTQQTEYGGQRPDDE